MSCDRKDNKFFTFATFLPIIYLFFACINMCLFNHCQYRHNTYFENSPE